MGEPAGTTKEWLLVQFRKFIGEAYAIVGPLDEDEGIFWIKLNVAESGTTLSITLRDNILKIFYLDFLEESGNSWKWGCWEEFLVLLLVNLWTWDTKA